MAVSISTTPPAGLFDRMRHAGATIASADDYRRAVVRNLQDLLGTTQQWSADELARTPEVMGSVLNYGVPPITGRVITKDSADDAAREIRAAILRFDRRFDERTFRVRASLAEQGTRRDVVQLTLEGDLLGLPEPIPFFAVVTADFDNGQIDVVSEGRER